MTTNPEEKRPLSLEQEAEAYAYEYANDAHGEECVKSDGAEPHWQETYDDCKRAYIAGAKRGHAKGFEQAREGLAVYQDNEVDYKVEFQFDAQEEAMKEWLK